MDELKTLFDKRRKLLEQKKGVLLEISLKNCLDNLNSYLKQKDYKKIIETYKIIKDKNYIEEEKKIMNFIINEVSYLLAHDKLNQLKLITDEIDNSLAALINDKIVEYFKNKINKNSKNLLANDTYEMYQLVIILDNANKFNLQEELSNILGDRINIFIKNGSNLIKEDGTDLLSIDKWIEECYLFLEVKLEVKKDELLNLLSDLEILYLKNCINFIFIKDKVHGSKDLLFLVKRILKRQSVVNLCIKDKIKQIVLECKILNGEELEYFYKIIEN